MSVSKRFTKSSVNGSHFAEIVAEVGLMKYSVELRVDKILEQRRSGFLSAKTQLENGWTMVYLSGNGFDVKFGFRRNEISYYNIKSRWRIPGFIGSCNSNIYHLHECSEVARIKPENIRKYESAPRGKRIHGECPT